MATEQEREGRLDTNGKEDLAGVAEMQEALNLVYGDRQASYGSPREAYIALAKVWSGLLADKLKEDITPEQAVLMLAAMKINRQSHRPKRDNVVDLHGYGLVLSRVQEGR